MSETFQITVQDEQLRAVVADAIAQLEQPRPLYDAIGAVMEMNVSIRFDTRTDPAGRAWEPLSALTPKFYALTTTKAGQRKAPGKEGWADLRETKKSIKPDQNGGQATLIRTGQMRDSLSHQATDDFVAIGFNRLTPGGKYQVALLHEWGTKSMPRRGLLTASPATGELGEADKADVLDEVERFLHGIL